MGEDEREPTNRPRALWLRQRYYREQNTWRDGKYSTPAQILSIKTFTEGTMRWQSPGVSQCLWPSMLGPEQLNDFATFMYCRLNHPDIDHPKELFEMTK